MKRHDDLTIVIVSYDSGSELKHCLESIHAQSIRPRQIIVVENGAPEGTRQLLRREHASVELIESRANAGYTGGNNLGVAAATAGWVLILNPDTVLEPDAIDALMSLARHHPRALVTPKLLNPDGSINACGLEMHVSGIAACRGLGEPASNYIGTQEVPLASGAALLFRKSIFQEIGGFDEQFFMYMEDVDLSLRARLLGFEILCAGNARVRHAYELGMTPEKFYLLDRNRLATYLKIMKRQTLLRLAPAMALAELATWAFALLRGPDYVKAKAQVYRWLLRHRASLRTAHEQIQLTRTCSDVALLAHATYELPLRQLTPGALAPRVFSRTIAALFRLVTPSLWAVKAASAR